jgi:hypothetical protein
VVEVVLEEMDGFPWLLVAEGCGRMFVREEEEDGDFGCNIDRHVVVRRLGSSSEKM